MHVVVGCMNFPEVTIDVNDGLETCSTHGNTLGTTAEFLVRDPDNVSFCITKKDCPEMTILRKARGDYMKNIKR